VCDKCQALNATIEKYRTLSKLVTDKQALAGIELLISRCEAQKRELHPER